MRCCRAPERTISRKRRRAAVQFQYGRRMLRSSRFAVLLSRAVSMTALSSGGAGAVLTPGRGELAIAAEAPVLVWFSSWSC